MMKNYRSATIIFLALLVSVTSIANDVTLIIFRPPLRPPFNDSVKVTNPAGPLFSRPKYSTDITCDVTGKVLTLFCEQDNGRVDILIYSPLSGMMHSETISLMGGDVHSIEVNYPAGWYKIRLTLPDGTYYEGNFEIE